MNRFIVLRTIIIGDIHGCDDQLKKILGKLQPDPETDMLILLGDLFDRGPESWEVFQTVKGLRKDYGDRFILLRGNHEDYLLRENISFMDNLVWVRVGKKDTIRSFRSHGQKMESAIPWLKDNIINYYKGGNFQCVHAGIKIDPLEANDTYTLIHDHDVVVQNRYTGPLTITGHIALEKPVWFAGDGETFETLEYGRRRQLPERGVLCIDTGCGKGGKLTAMVIEDGDYTLFSSL